MRELLIWAFGKLRAWADMSGPEANECIEDGMRME